VTSQSEKAKTFQRLHQGPGAFIIPNPWDAGSARLLAALDFPALATTSFGLSNVLGRANARVSGEEVLENCRVIAEATSLPVNVDLENCFADDPRTAAAMITRAAEAGAVGGSIEDATGRRDAPIYDFTLAVERVAAAVEAARALPFPFLLTARAENLLHGRDDLDDTIRRLQAFEAAGADVLYAPGLRDLAAIRRVVQAVSKPVNVVMGFADTSITFEQLSEAGVRRVSIGGALSRYVLGSLVRAAREMQVEGRFTFIDDALPAQDILHLLRNAT
jgi:2-methylisocitrate lyase-like PEP mutase family enzyme